MMTNFDSDNRKFRYPALIHKDEGSAFGVTVPDLPGCFSAGDTSDEALEKTKEAIGAFLSLLAEDKQWLPYPSTVDSHKKNPDFSDGGWLYVEVVMPGSVIQLQHDQFLLWHNMNMR